MMHHTSSASAVSTCTARCRLLLDLASEEEVAREIPTARWCGGDGEEIPTGLRQAAMGERREVGEGGGS